MIAVAKITDRYMTVPEAMEALPASAHTTVIRMIESGKLEGEKVAGRWLVLRKSVAALREKEAASETRIGRPRLSPSRKKRS